MSSEGLFQRIFKNLSWHMRKNNFEQEHFRDFAKLDDNASRVSYLLAIQGAQELLTVSPLKTSKSLSKALSLKNEGNVFFQKKKYTLAVAAYNQALMLTPLTDNDGLIALCLANRSAALYGMQKYQECLTDIEMAISSGYPKDMLYKILTRRAKCHQQRNCADFNISIEEALASLETSSLDVAGRSVWKTAITELTPQHEHQDVVTHVKPKLTFDRDNINDHTALSRSAGINESSEFGRFVQAEAQISPGDIILVEKPFCSVTLPENYTTHCSHCQSSVRLAVYPCRSCADVVYCDKNCEQSSWDGYHKFECEYTLNLINININMGHLALRSALKAGFRSLNDIFEGNLETLENCKGYKNIYYLQGHEDDRTAKDLFWRTAASLVLASLCNIDEWSKGNVHSLLVLATFVLHHMQIFPCNAHEISEVHYDEQLPYQSELVEIGAGIYETLSMFNHSCDPSVVRTFQDGNTCIMKALSPVEESEQIYDNYGALYATHSAKSRQGNLLSQYYFQCSCTACMQSWPMYDTLSYSDVPLYKCAGCNFMIIPPFEKHCDNCHEVFDKLSVDRQLAEAKKDFDKTLTELFSSNYKQYDAAKAIKKLEDYSQLVNGLVFRPIKTLNDCQEALKHLYGLSGNMV